jgi:hypothetical protein
VNVLIVFTIIYLIFFFVWFSKRCDDDVSVVRGLLYVHVVDFVCVRSNQPTQRQWIFIRQALLFGGGMSHFKLLLLRQGVRDHSVVHRFDQIRGLEPEGIKCDIILGTH